METVGLHHVSINVSDVPRARDFYVGVLGLTERGDRPDFGFAGAWLDAGGQQIHLIEAPPPPSLGQHLALRHRRVERHVALLDLRDLSGEVQHLVLELSAVVTAGQRSDDAAVTECVGEQDTQLLGVQLVDLAEEQRGLDVGYQGTQRLLRELQPRLQLDDLEAGPEVSC